MWLFEKKNERRKKRNEKEMEVLYITEKYICVHSSFTLMFDTIFTLDDYNKKNQNIYYFFIKNFHVLK